MRRVSGIWRLLRAAKLQSAPGAESDNQRYAAVSTGGDTPAGTKA